MDNDNFFLNPASQVISFYWKYIHETKSLEDPSDTWVIYDLEMISFKRMPLITYQQNLHPEMAEESKYFPVFCEMHNQIKDEITPLLPGDYVVINIPMRTMETAFQPVRKPYNLLTLTDDDNLKVRFVKFNKQRMKIFKVELCQATPEQKRRAIEYYEWKEKDAEKKNKFYHNIVKRWKAKKKTTERVIEHEELLVQ